MEPKNRLFPAFILIDRQFEWLLLQNENEKKKSNRKIWNRNFVFSFCSQLDVADLYKQKSDIGRYNWIQSDNFQILHNQTCFLLICFFVRGFCLSSDAEEVILVFEQWW